MAVNKTTETNAPVADYLSGIEDVKKRQDTEVLVNIIQAETGYEPKMWGTGIIGFGSYHYRYDSGHEGDAPLAGLAARKSAISIYLSPEFDQKEALLQFFGKHKVGKGCLYVQKLADIDVEILKKMVRLSVAHIKRIYPA